MIAISLRLQQLTENFDLRLFKRPLFLRGENLGHPDHLVLNTGLVINRVEFVGRDLDFGVLAMEGQCPLLESLPDHLPKSFLVGKELIVLPSDKTKVFILLALDIFDTLLVAFLNQVFHVISLYRGVHDLPYSCHTDVK